MITFTTDYRLTSMTTLQQTSTYTHTTPDSTREVPSPLPTTTAEMHNILYHGAKLWNELPNHITNIANQRITMILLIGQYLLSCSFPPSTDIKIKT